MKAGKVGLARGDTGAAVRARRRLAATGFDPGATDGRFGPRTCPALGAYQRGNGVGVTGRADPETATALLDADISVRDPATLRRLRVHVGRFGFVDDVPGENWHRTWRRWPGRAGALTRWRGRTCRRP